MKAKYKEKFDRYILSIGMIVKNEEKNLRACLEALKPLREAVPSELIIVDTGSEDRTVEIAREFTDKVYFYEWNKDFAAARNYGLDRATGQWFMYLDADEQLADPEELISFFQAEEESRPYNTAEITVRSFLGKDLVQYSDFTAARIFRMNIGNRFWGMIHEVPKRIMPIKILCQSRLNHYGYVYETDEEKKRKFQRNNELLEIELDKSPNDPRLICLYSASCPDEIRLDLLEHGRAIIQGQPEHYYFPEMYWRLSRELCRSGNHDRLVEIVEEYKSNTTRDHVGEIELAYNLGFSYFQKNQYQESAAAYERYLELYERYQDGSLIQGDNASNVCERASLTIYNFVLLQIVNCFLNLKEYERAFTFLVRTDLKEIQENSDKNCILLLAKIVFNSKHFDWLVRADQWIKELHLPEGREQPYVTNIVNLYLQSADRPEWSLKPEKSASLLGKLLCIDNSGEWDELISRFTKKENHLEVEQYGIVAIYQGIQNRRPLNTLLQSSKVETLQKWNIRLAKQVKNLGEILLNYHLEEKEQNNLLMRFWLADLETRVMDSCGEECRLPMAHRITEDLSWYVNHLYNNNILTPEGICVLPSVQRFAYWCGQALAAREQGDTSGYIKLLGEASRACPEMAEVAKLLIQEVRDNDETLKAQREQQELAKKIKGIIEGMILAGNKEDAQSILAQYELIAPGDPDIPSLKAAILQQPALSET